MKTKILTYLGRLEQEPDNEALMVKLRSAASDLSPADVDTDVLQNLTVTRARLLEAGYAEQALEVLEQELGLHSDPAVKADLMYEKGRILDDELLEQDKAVECFNRVLEFEGEHKGAQEKLETISTTKENWEKIVQRYVENAEASTAKDLTTSLYASTAELYQKNKPGSDEVEQYLRKSLEVDPSNRKAYGHLERLLRGAERWEDLLKLHEARAEAVDDSAARAGALLSAARVQEKHLGNREAAQDLYRQVLGADPANQRALNALVEVYTAEENWEGLIQVYEKSLKIKGREADLGTYLQIGMLWWKKLGNVESAEPYFRRVSKVEPGQPLLREFYREYYESLGDFKSLLNLLRQAQHQAKEEAEKVELGEEMARLAEQKVGDPERAIDLWKGVLRHRPDHQEGKDSLKRLYAATEKWNALLEILKEEVDAFSDAQVDEKVARLLQMVEIYGKLRVDVMVLNTYNAILAIQPDNMEVLVALAEKYESAGRVNDLIGVLTKQAEAAQTPSERKDLLRRVASLWIDKVGNHNKAIEPLEEILNIDPADGQALERLKEIYERRRNWRSLLDLYYRELEILPKGQHRDRLREMADLAQKRLGDPKAAIGIWNKVLELEPREGEAMEALAHLYERERRWPALAEMLERKLDTLTDEEERVQTMERLGTLWGDRIGGARHAIEIWKNVLETRPGHSKALRVLRDLYAAAADWSALETLFAEQGNWPDFIETLHHAADRTEDVGAKVALYFKVAETWIERLDTPKRAAKAYERVLAVDGDNLKAAQALVPIYSEGQNWPRLMTTYEVLLRHEEDRPRRMELMREIWSICEEKLGNKSDAFGWCAKAYAEASEDGGLQEELERLASEARAWKPLVEIYKKRVGEVGDEEAKAVFYRKMADIAFQRLNQYEEAQGFYQEVLKRTPEDEGSLDALEEIFASTQNWPKLLEVYLKRVEMEASSENKVEILFKAGLIQEERLDDLDGAAGTYDRVLDLTPSNARALRALEKLHEARADWPALVSVLRRQLDLEGAERVGLLFRLGTLYEERLSDPSAAVDAYKEALASEPLHRPSVDALEKYLAPSGPHTVGVASVLAPYYERTESWEELGRALEILLEAEQNERERLDFMKRLSVIYGRKLGDPERALRNAVRVFEVSPQDEDNRRELRELAELQGEWDGVTSHYASAISQAPDELKKDLSWELARVFDEGISDSQKARPYFEQVLQLDESHLGAFEALRRILQETEDYPALRELLHRRSSLLTDLDGKKDLLFQICNLNEDVLSDPTAAIRTYQEVLELEPGNTTAFAALERLFSTQSRWADLESLLARELDYTDNNDRIADLQYRRGRLLAEQLGNPSGAVDIFQDVLALSRAHPPTVEALESLVDQENLRQRIASILEPIYTAAETWGKLVSILEVRLEAFQDDAAASVDLLARIADLQKERLGDPDASFGTWRRALKLMPSDSRVRESLDQLVSEGERWQEAAEVWEEGLSAADAAEVDLKSEFMIKLAVLHEQKILDPDKAVHWYRKLLENDPGNLDTAQMAAGALERLYETAADWTNLVEILKRQVDWSEDVETRKGHLFRIAEIQEHYLGEEGQAVETYRTLVDLDAEDRRALDSLEKLYIRAERWLDLVGILRRRVDVSTDADERRELWSRMAMLHEEALEDPEEACRAWSTLLDERPEDLEAIRSLSRLYEQAQRWRDLYDMLDRELNLTQDVPSRVALSFRVGNILHRKLDDAERALYRYRQVLEMDQEHQAARGALEELLSDDMLALHAAEILEPLYTAESNWPRLCDIYALKASSTADPAEKVSIYRRVADIQETGLGDTRRAFDSYGQALQEAVGLPELEDVMGSLERLTSTDARWQDLVDLYRRVSDDVLDVSMQEKMRLTVADLSRHRLSDLETAKDFYRRVLDSDAHNTHALDALEAIYADTSDYEPLLDILRRRAELEAPDPKRRRDYLARAAQLCEEVLERSEDAISLWEQVLETSAGDRQASAALERLYTRAQRWADLADLLERRLSSAETINEAVELRFRMGLMWEEQLVDPDKALMNFRAALGGNPGHADTISRIEKYLEDPDRKAEAAEILEPIYASRQDWARLIEIYKIRREATDSPDVKPVLTRRIAMLYEEQMEDLEQAFEWYGQLFVENPEERGIRDQIHRLAGILEKWEQLAGFYAAYLDGVFEETPTSLQVAQELARTYDERMGEVDKAKVCYLRVLNHDRSQKEVFGALERMLNRTERWQDLLEVYRDAADNALDMEERKALLFKICIIWEEALENRDEAIDAYRAILDMGDNDANAVAALDRLFIQQERWTDLVELLHRQLDFVSGDDQVTALKLKLGRIYQEKLDDTPAAIDCYEEVLNLSPANADAVAALERLILDEDHRLRIAQILEPVYKRMDEWKKLVVIYDTQLEFIDDKVRRVEILLEISGLHEERGQDLSLAFEAMARAWTEDVSDMGVLQKLESLSTRLGDWGRLVDVLQKGVEGSFDYELLSTVYAKIARIQEEALRDSSKAAEAYFKLLQVREDSMEAVQALERLLPGLQRYEELVSILAKKAEMIGDPLESVEVYYKMAEVQETVLGKVDDAVTTWRQVQSISDEDELALSALERLFTAQANWTELVSVLQRKVELAADDATRRQLRFQLADVFENKLKESFEAISAYRTVLGSDPNDREALQALDRLYTSEKSWADLLEVLEQQAALETDLEAKNRFVFRSGWVTQHEMNEEERAIDYYRRVLETDPNHSDSRGALEALVRSETAREPAAAVLLPLLRASQQWQPLCEIQELRLKSEGEPARRTELLLNLAQTYEEGLGDRSAAFDAYGRALAEEPASESVQMHLERLAMELGDWQRLADLYKKRLEDIYDTELGLKLNMTLARIYEEALGNDGEAIERYRKALEFAADDAKALAAMDRLLQKNERWDELADILLREVDASTDPDAQAEFLFRLGWVRRDRFQDANAALSAFSEVTARNPSHPGALSAMEAMLDDAERVGRVLDILEPVYEAGGQYAKLVELGRRRLPLLTDPTDKAQLLERLAETCENRLQDGLGALSAIGEALTYNPTELRYLDDMARLGEGTGDWATVVRIGEAVLGASEEASVIRDVGIRTAKWSIRRLSDMDRGEALYKKVMEVDESNLEALEALEAIYRAKVEIEPLIEVLWKRAELEYDMEKKKAVLSEVAQMAETNLGDPAAAAKAWRALVEQDESDRDAQNALIRLYEAAGQWEELVSAIQHKTRFVDDHQEAIQLKHRVGRLLMEQVQDVDRAIGVYKDILDLEPQDEPAMNALEAIHASRDEWSDVQDIVLRRMSAVDPGPGRIEYYKKLAGLAEEKFKNVDEAVSYWHQILDTDAGHVEAYQQLERLFEKEEKWYDLIDILKRHSEHHEALGEKDAQVTLLVKISNIWEARLESPESATEILEKILEAEPTNVAALNGLARIYESLQDWDRCSEVLEKAAATGPQGRDAAELYFRRGRVAEQRGNKEEALSHYSKALEFDQTHAEAIAALETAARQAGDWATVAQLVHMKASTATDPEERLQLLCELGSLFAEKLGQPEGGLPFLEQALQMAPDNPDVLMPLADLYFAANRMDDAEKLYRDLVEQLSKGRRSKKLGEIYYRLAKLAERRSDPGAALQQYEQAYKIDTTYAPTLVALGRLYMDAKDWEKARRMFRSMLLQNIDEATTGMSKADVYYALGYIHVQVDEKKKAINMLERGLELQADHPKIRELLEQIKG